MENSSLIKTFERKVTDKRGMVLSNSKEPDEPTLGVKFVSAGLAACIGDLITFPLDTAKVRLQIQGETAALTAGSSQLMSAGKQAVVRYNGIVGTICTIYRTEGTRALYSGLIPGLQRQMCFASVRIGLYDFVKNVYSDKAAEYGYSKNSHTIRLMAGCTTGAMAVLFAQPTDVAKVRFQAQKLGEPRRYSGVIAAYQTIARQEGIRGLWKGTVPNITRNCVVNCCELASYDIIKSTLLSKNILNDNLPCHFVSGFGAGFITTVVASPVDVVKTRIMNSSMGTYSGVLDCAHKMYRAEGLLAFYKGFKPSFIRLASWNVVMFVTYEQLKKAIQNQNKNCNNNNKSGITIELDNLKRFM